MYCKIYMSWLKSYIVILICIPEFRTIQSLTIYESLFDS
jgi:hypothetical protein